MGHCSEASNELPQSSSTSNLSTSKSKSLRKSSSLMLKSLPSVFGGKHKKSEFLLQQAEESMLLGSINEETNCVIVMN